MLKCLGFLFYSELVLHFRRSQEWLYPLLFFIIVMSLFPIALTPDPVFLEKKIAGCMWIAALLASLLANQHLFSTEIEDGHIEQLALSPFPLPLIILIKIVAHWIIAELPLVLLAPLLGIFFHLSFVTNSVLFLSLLLGTPLLSLMSSLLVALTVGLRQQGVILGVLILPLVTPVFIFGVNMVFQFQAGLSIKGAVAFLGGMTFLAYAILPFVISFTLRLNLEN